MKRINSIISAAVCTITLTAVPFSVSAAEEKVYGTMNIPYADFYKAEIEDAYEVDAVSSATTKGKWGMNGKG